MDLAQRSLRSRPSCRLHHQPIGLALLAPAHRQRHHDVQARVKPQWPLDHVALKLSDGGDDALPSAVGQRRETGVSARVVTELVRHHRAQLVHGQTLEERNSQIHSAHSTDEPEEPGILFHCGVHLVGQPDMRGCAGHAAVSQLGDQCPEFGSTLGCNVDTRLHRQAERHHPDKRENDAERADRADDDDPYAGGAQYLRHRDTDDDDRGAERDGEDEEADQGDQRDGRTKRREHLGPVALLQRARISSARPTRRAARTDRS